MPKGKILLAMFDIRPKRLSASFVSVQIQKELNLLKKQEASPRELLSQTFIESAKPQAQNDYWEELIAKLPQRPDFSLKYELITLSRSTILKELERTMAETVDIGAEVAGIGGSVHEFVPVVPVSKVYVPQKAEIDLVNFWETGAEQMVATPEPELQVHSPASREIDTWLNNIQKDRRLLANRHEADKKSKFSFGATRIKPKWSSWFRFNRKAVVYFLSILLPGALIFGIVRYQSVLVRDNIVKNGDNAVANLTEAKHELENFNFLQAADNFALAYDDLNKASGTLNQLGISFLAVFGDLPGLNKIKAVNNLVEAGQNISKAGENLSLAFGTLYKTNLFSFLEESGGRRQSISVLLTEFKDVLNFADKNINKAQSLLGDIDISAIPEDKQQLFLDFKEKVPEFQRYIGEAVDYSDFLLELVGTNGTKTYLVLLQNNSELRPTGGFPGTYALITFERGSLKKIFVEDIYRADAKLKENIVPPIPLQHITPNWGMRDAAWFADFPTSARKVMQFYKLDGGPNVDGVLTITPDVIAKILEVVGPIEMPEYKLTIGADNFLAELQNEVEYEADRSAPKQILTDLQPLFFERLASQDKDRWLEIFKIISEAAEQKHILAYFENDKLQDAAVKNGLGGEIKSSPSAGSGQADYLQVVFLNIKGSKTDFVTDNSMSLETEIAGGDIGHSLKINRIHNGGSSKFGFYNRDNSAYVKVYVPRGAVLEGIQGQSITDYRSLIGHDDFGFKQDPDLQQIESTATHPFAGVDVFEESGKTVFGFWLITKPKQTKSVTISYQVPSASVCVLSASVCDNYKLYWQKQSGTGDDQISFSFKLPEGKKPSGYTQEIRLLGEALVLDSDLTTDRNIDITF